MDAMTARGTRYPFRFTGRGGEYFKIWIVNILLTVLTLYVYSAWAKVRTKRYFHGHTQLDGSAFEYHAKPLQILASRLLAAALLLLTTFGSYLSPVVPLLFGALLVFLLPWAMWRSLKFNARMTSYRNVRFGFDGPLGPLYVYQLILPVLPVLVLVSSGAYLNTLGLSLGNVLLGSAFVVGALMMPWIARLLASYTLYYYRYGMSAFSGELSTARYYGIFFTALLISIALLLLAGFLFFGAAAITGALSFSMLSEAKPQLGKENMQALIVLGVGGFYLSAFTFGLFILAFWRARVRRHVYSRAVLGGRVRFESTVSAWGLWGVTFSNIIMTGLTLGLFIPFAKVRMARYLASHSVLYSDEPLNQFVGERREEVGAFGDELGDAFDMDMDVGF